jgi:hypothetical protein
MLPGINEDIPRGNRTYHLQTEDRGERNPAIVSVLFLEGAVLATERASYEDLVGTKDLIRECSKMMIRQHRDVLRRVLDGEFDDASAEPRVMTEMDSILDAVTAPELGIVDDPPLPPAHEGDGATPTLEPPPAPEGVVVELEAAAEEEPEPPTGPLAIPGLPVPGMPVPVTSADAAEPPAAEEATLDADEAGDGADEGPELEAVTDEPPEAEHAEAGPADAEPPPAAAAATGFCADVITDRPLALLIAMQLAEMEAPPP